MIRYDDFVTNKWKVNAVGDWTKLGVTVYRNGDFLVIKLRYDEPYSCQFTRYADWYTITMEGLVALIKKSIRITFTHKAYNKMYIPKYKRTLNNWILNDCT